MRGRPRRIGFAATSVAGSFLSLGSTFRPRRSSTAVTPPSSSSPDVPPLQSSFALAPSSRPFELELDLPRFRPSSRHHPRASTHHEASQGLVTFRPQAFSASRRFPPRMGSRACFIPLPRPGSSCSGPLPLRAATLPHREEPAPLPFARPSLTDRDRLPRGTRGTSRLPSARRLRSFRLSYSPLRRSLPSSGFSPPGVLSSPWPRFTRGAPLLALPSTAFAFALALFGRLQRVLRENFDWFVSAPANLLEFSSLPSGCPRTLGR